MAEDQSFTTSIEDLDSALRNLAETKLRPCNACGSHEWDILGPIGTVEFAEPGDANLTRRPYKMIRCSDCGNTLFFDTEKLKNHA